MYISVLHCAQPFPRLYGVGYNARNHWPYRAYPSRLLCVYLAIIVEFLHVRAPDPSNYLQCGPPVVAGCTPVSNSRNPYVKLTNCDLDARVD